MSISIEQAKRLFEGGHISSDLYDKLSKSHTDREETEALTSAGKEDLIPRPPTQAEMEKFRTWGTPPPNVAAQDSPKSPEPAADAEDAALLTPPTEMPSDGGGTSKLAFNQKIDDPNAPESGSGIQMGGDPHDPLNGEIPAPPQPVFQGPAQHGIAAMNAQQDSGQGVPLSGFQRGISSQDGVPANAPQSTTPPGRINMPEQTVTSTEKPTPVVDDYQGPSSTNPYSAGAQKRTGGAPVQARPGDAFTNIIQDAISPVVDPKFQSDPGQKAMVKPAAQVAAEAAKNGGAAAPGSLASDATAGKAGPPGGGGGGVSSGPPPMMGQHLADLEKSYQDQKSGLKASADSDVAEGTLLNSHMQNQQYDLMARERAQQEDAAKSQQVMQQRLDEIDKKNTELQNTKIDPHRLYNNSSTGEKILGGLALALGAMGAASPYNHGENKAWTVISGAIDRDLKAQQVDLETGFAGTKARSGLLRDYMDVTKDKRVAYEAARGDYLQRAKMQLDAIGANFKGPQAQARYKVAAGQLDERLAEQKLKLDQALLAAGKGGGMGAPKGESEDLRYVSEQSLKEGIPALEATLDEVDKAADSGETMGLVARDALDTAGHIPIIGSIAKKAYGAAEPEAARNEQSIQLLNQTVRKAMTGVGFSEKEADTYSTQLFSDRSPEGIKKGVALMRKVISAKRAEIEAGIGNRPEKNVTSRGRSAREESELRHGEEATVQAGVARKQNGPGVPGAAK